MRSKRGYWIGGAIAAVGVVAAIAWFVISLARLDNEIDAFHRVPAPGEQTFRLEAQKYVVYFENFPTQKMIPTPEEVTIADAQSDRQLEIEPYVTSLTYSFGGRDGTAVGTVTPPDADDYVVRVGEAEGASNPSVALGESISGPLVRGIAGTFAIGGLLVLGGVILMVVTAIRIHANAPGPPPS